MTMQCMNSVLLSSLSFPGFMCASVLVGVIDSVHIWDLEGAHPVNTFDGTAPAFGEKTAFFFERER